MSLRLSKLAVKVSNASPQKSFWASRQATLVAGALILLAVLAAYCNTFSVPFTFDDQPAIIENATLRHLWPIHRALSPPPGGITVSGRPVLNLSLALNYALSGTKVWSYHALNLAIHILASLTLLGIVRRTLLAPLWKNRFERSALPLALAVALLWALHPLQTEAVTYVIQRAESLMGLFYLLTLYCFIRAALGISNLKFQISNTAGPHPISNLKSQISNTAGPRPISNLKSQISNTAGPRPISNLKFQISNLWFVLCIAACLLGMGTKEVMVSAPLMVLLYDRTFIAGSFARALRQRWGLYTGLAATWLLLVAEFGAQNANSNAALSPWTYALTQCWAIVHYLCLAVWPHPLVFDYGQSLIQRIGEAAPWALIVFTLVAGTIVSLRRWPVIGFLGFWFFAILAPTSSVMPLAGQTVAEHRMYLPLAAIVILAALAVHALAGSASLAKPSAAAPDAALPKQAAVPGAWRPAHRGWNSHVHWPLARNWRRIEIAVFLMAPFLLIALTVHRNHDYRAQVALWTDTVAKCANNPRAHNRLGVALAQNGQAAEAITQLQTAVSLQANYADARNNLGNILQEAGRLDEATAQFQAALAIWPENPKILVNLGKTLSLQGRGREAFDEYQKALSHEPDLIEAHEGLAGLFLKEGRLEEAEDHYETALRLDPDEATAQIGLAAALAMSGRFKEAIPHFTKALKLNPHDLSALNNLAWLLATCPDATIRDGAKAVELGERANELAGGSNPTVLRALAAAYAEAGSFAEAVAAAQRALDVAAAQSNSVVADSARAQLRLYQAGLPFRDAASTNAAAGRKN